MSTSPEGIYEPGIVDPGVPVRNPTQPYWLTEPSKISKLQSSWHDEAEIVIVGSGITSASLVRSLYARRPDLKIIVVEARDLCSGATGRNGGHIKVMSPGVYLERMQQYGRQEAIRLTQFEHSHLDEIDACVKENNIQCDLRRLEGLDCYHDPVIFNRAISALEDMRKHVPDLAARYTVYTSRKDLDDRHCPLECIGAVGIPSGSVWPYKFVTSLFEKYVRENGLSIQTNTAVTSIDDNPNNDVAVVRTTRGDIRARHVVLAANAWISHLVPELQPFVSPVRVNIQRHLPEPVKFRVDNSYWIRYGEKDYDYLIQRPDGAFIVGRANTGRRTTSDDSTKDLLPQTHLRTVVREIFDFKTDKVQVTHAWSGVVAFTQDANPFIGRLPTPNRSHQWVCGAYHAIGMVRAFRSAQMLACMILQEDIPFEYPRSMLISEKRLAGLGKSVRSSKL